MARRRLTEAVEASRATGDDATLATALKHLGLVALHNRPPDQAEAARLLEESLALRRSLHDVDGTASCLNDLAIVALQRDQYARAAELLEESLTLCRGVGNAYALSFVLKNLSAVAVVLGDFERAQTLLCESVALSHSLSSREGVGCALTAFAALAAAENQPVRAAQLIGAAEALRDAVGAALSDMERAAYDRHFERGREQLGASAWATHVQDGRALSMDSAVAYALDGTSAE
jgi:tetratricopeptide (TPR) repeat protein